MGVPSPRCGCVQLSRGSHGGSGLLSLPFRHVGLSHPLVWPRPGQWPGFPGLNVSHSHTFDVQDTRALVVLQVKVSCSQTTLSLRWHQCGEAKSQWLTRLEPA